jgi:hypothetical protein
MFALDFFDTLGMEKVVPGDTLQIKLLVAQIEFTTEKKLRSGKLTKSSNTKFQARPEQYANNNRKSNNPAIVTYILSFIASSRVRL